ncbi:MAG: hypothetical protein KDE56_21550 [Anaerolineales bacterium]|nr:hypothetical protein [Anaerolineales bacterium]
MRPHESAGTSKQTACFRSATAVSPPPHLFPKQDRQSVSGKRPFPRTLIPNQTMV